MIIVEQGPSFLHDATFLSAVAPVSHYNYNHRNQLISFMQKGILSSPTLFPVLSYTLFCTLWLFCQRNAIHLKYKIALSERHQRMLLAPIEVHCILISLKKRLNHKFVKKTLTQSFTCKLLLVFIKRLRGEHKWIVVSVTIISQKWKTSKVLFRYLLSSLLFMEWSHWPSGDPQLCWQYWLAYVLPI